MTVVDFREAQLATGPHWQGPAVCLACRNEWEAVAPTGTHHVECPGCHLVRGVPKFNFGCAEGDMGFSCHCEAEMFFFRRRAERVQILCVGCGEEKSVDTIFGAAP